jgi:regulator of protease activity HflC (stomatin/prohibitin superfamily)
MEEGDMLMVRGLLMAVGFGLGAAAAGVLAWGLARRLLARFRGTEPQPLRLKLALQFAALAPLPTLCAQSLVLVPAGRAGVRVSQLSGTLPGTLPAGVHIVRPLIDDVVLYDVREQVLHTAGGPAPKGEVLLAQTKEGLSIGLAVTVRYRLDARRLDQIHSNLPSVQGLVSPVVGAVFRQIVPNYMVREVFATKREEIREKAAAVITGKLGADGILVREVLLRDVDLPPEYAKGLEGLLLKEQQNERMTYDIQIKEKEVKTAELEAEAEKARHIKQAEAAAAVRVLQAKAEADAMQHTLPLKEKQIEQTRLEAEARKEATLKNAEATAQAKIIDSRADVERSNLMAGAEAHRIRVTSEAENERMMLEAAVLRDNPLFIQKIVAERLSDKMQIMMVPMDGRNFFANEVFREAALPLVSPPPVDGRRAAQRKEGR